MINCSSLDVNITEPSIKRTLRITPIGRARTISESAFADLITLATFEAEIFIRDHGRKAPADFISWRVRHSGVSYLLNKSLGTSGVFSYGLLYEATLLLKWQLPDVRLKESNLAVYDQVVGRDDVLVAKGFIGMIGEISGSLDGTEANGGLQVVGGMPNGSLVATT